MGIINRFFCFVFSLTTGIAALCFLFSALKIIPDDVFFNELLFLLNRQEAPAVIGIVILFSFYFLCVSLFSGGDKKKSAPKEMQLVASDGGAVNITLEAVKNLAERAALNVHSVREAAAKITGGDTASLNVGINIAVSAGANAPAVSNAVLKEINDNLRSSLSVTDAKINVSVTDISNMTANRRVV